MCKYKQITLGDQGFGLKFSRKYWSKMLEFHGSLTDETIKIFYTLNETKHFFYNPYNLYMSIICLFIPDRVNVWETVEF